MMTKNILKKLLLIQKELKAPKGQYNSFGKYKYRSCEDILENARPLANNNGCVIILNDNVRDMNGRYYIEATATLFDVDSGEEISAKALARESEKGKNGMDESQVTGASSSYARKYALSALFALDDTKDADTIDNREPANKQTSKPMQDEKSKHLSSVLTKAKSKGIENSKISILIKAKYNKSSSKFLTAEEAKDLDVNFYTYIDLLNQPKKSSYQEDDDMEELKRMSDEQQEKTNKLAKEIEEYEKNHKYETFATYGTENDTNTGDMI